MKITMIGHSTVLIEIALNSSAKVREKLLLKISEQFKKLIFEIKNSIPAAKLDAITLISEQEFKNRT